MISPGFLNVVTVIVIVARGRSSPIKFINVQACLCFLMVVVGKILICYDDGKRYSVS